ncbi:MAG: SCO family protein [Cellulomonas sp.]
MRSGVRTAAVLAAGILALTGCGSPRQPAEGPVTNVTMHDDDGMHGIVLPRPYEVADLSLTATDGTAYRLAADTDKPLTLVFFGYTQCPDICQVVMADIASALTRLGDGERDQVGMLFVTTDPARDDAATLRAYLDRFDPSFEGLTGPLPRIVEAGDSLGVAIEKGEKLPSGGYEVSHGTNVVGLLPDGTGPLVWTQGTSPEQIAEDIHVVLSDGVPTGETE